MDQQEHEVWRNASQGVVFVWKSDNLGRIKDEVIKPGAKFAISSAERLQNMEDAATADLDNFRNGRLVPVKLLDGTEDKAEIASNPNLIAEGEMRELMTSHWRTFEAKISQISSVGTLNRILEIANEGDATVRQVETLKARIAELSPKTVEVTASSIGVNTGTAAGASGRPL